MSLECLSRLSFIIQRHPRRRKPWDDGPHDTEPEEAARRNGRLASPSPPSSSFRPRSPTKDDLEPNAHPYPIRTNSAAALARSTSGWGLARHAAPLHPHPAPRCPIAGAAGATRAGVGAGPARAAGATGREQQQPREQACGRDAGTAAVEAVDARAAGGAPGQRGVERGGGVGGEARRGRAGAHADVGGGDGGDGMSPCALYIRIHPSTVVPSLRCPIFFPLHIPFGPRQSPLLVTTYSALPIHSTFTSWSRIRITATPPFHTPPLYSVGPRRFLLPRLPLSPPLAAHSPLRSIFISISIHFVRPSSRLPVLLVHIPIHCPLPLRPPNYTHSHPHPISSMPWRSPAPLTRARILPGRVLWLSLPFLRVSYIHPSALYHNSPPLSSLPCRSRGLPTRPFHHFPPF
ncbi:hypothetical protein DFH09DRAFT_1438440 [Mycena vulgaris]|nr:hypothetical protein DFH09DRAFT_1438440 [Mycena vulgaris]